MTGTAPTTVPEPTFRLIYRSHSRIRPEDRSLVLAEIFREARSNNKKSGITGALLVTDHWFVQALEGEETVVRAVYDRIRTDDRHEDLTVVDQATVDARVFSRWAMAQVSRSGQADIPLHAAEGGIHAAAGEPVTREQFAVLKGMRETIGADVV
jgi:hypothetical protein